MSKNDKNTQEPTIEKLREDDLDLVVSLDLGTTEVRGICARRRPDATSGSPSIEIVAKNYEPTPPNAIKRGAILNVKDVAQCIRAVCKRLLDEVERKCGEQVRSRQAEAVKAEGVVNAGEKLLTSLDISQVYVGLNGQGIKCSIKKVSRAFNDEIISEELVSTLREEARGGFSDDELLLMEPIHYLVDDEPNDNPVGCRCESFQAKYILVTAKADLLNSVKQCLSLAGLSLAGFSVAPVAQANAILADTEKELGTMLVDFGASSTSVAMYHGKRLRYAYVLPFGSQLINSDIRGLKIVETEAELLKCKIGNMRRDMAKPATEITLEESKKTVSDTTICQMIERRMETLLPYLESVIAESRLTPGPELDQLVICGRGALLGGLVNGCTESLGLKTRIGCISKRLQPLEPVLTGVREADYSGRRGGSAHYLKDRAKAFYRYSQALGVFLDASKGCVRATTVKEIPAKQKLSVVSKLKVGITTLFKGEVMD